MEMGWKGAEDAVPEVPQKAAQDAAYCYKNDDPTRAAVAAQVNTDLNRDSTLRCDDALTHTYVPANRALPAVPGVPAIAPSPASM